MFLRHNENFSGFFQHNFWFFDVSGRKTFFRVLRVTSDCFWSYGTDESFRDTCGKYLQFFRHCETFSKKKSFGQREPHSLLEEFLAGKSVLRT